MRISPVVGSVSLAKQRMSVDFPAPLGPMTPKTSFSSISRLMFWIAGTFRKTLPRDLILIIVYSSKLKNCFRACPKPTLRLFEYKNGKALSRILSRAIIPLGDLLPNPSSDLLKAYTVLGSTHLNYLASDRVYNASSYPECERENSRTFQP